MAAPCASAVWILPPRAAVRRLALPARWASTTTAMTRAPRQRIGARPHAPLSPGASTTTTTTTRRAYASFPAPSRPARAAGGSEAAAATAAPTPAPPSSSEPTAADSAGGAPLPSAPEGGGVDWSSSFHGLSTTPFSAEAAAKLMTPLDPQDIEIKPDGILYLPEIKYRRILNAAFGPGGWGLAPRGELAVGDKVVSREYALVAHGRFVGQARGECPVFGGEDGVATAGEGCKSNALMRCCKDLGVASELWDPRFLRQFKKEHCREVWVEHVVTKKRRQIWLRKDCPPTYPYALATGSASKAR